jgi:hypothetical protein
MIEDLRSNDVEASVLSSAEPQAWHDALSSFDHASIYASLEYHAVYEHAFGTPAFAYLARSPKGVLFYPFFLKPIEHVGEEPVSEDWYDLETVYGYCGPLSTTDDKAFLDTAWAPYQSWRARHGVVCEFIRFDPFLSNHRFAPPGVTTHFDRRTVAIELHKGKDELVSNYASVQRNRVRKAQKNGLVCRCLSAKDGLDDFKPLYRQTMEHLEADSFYHFSDDYFDALIRELDDQLRIFTVVSDAKPIASAIIFLDGEKLHYHLGGSSVGDRNLAPNNFLFHEISIWGIENGHHEFHLGGGRTNLDDDSLLRFKRNFSKNTKEFYIGKSVHDDNAYDQLATRWLRQSGLDSLPNILQFYRMSA